MKIRIKNLAIWSSVFVAIFLSFALPNFWFQLEDSNMNQEMYKRARKETKIDVQAEKIYLVNAIHSIGLGYYNVETDQYKEYEITRQGVVEVAEVEKTRKENIIDELKNEVSQMEEYQILNHPFEEENTEYKSFAILRKEYNQYNVESIYAKSETCELHAEIEEKTGKIILIRFHQSNMNLNHGIEEIMRNYVKYLDLYIIDDWEMENGMLKSEKAQLAVVLTTSGDSCLLTIYPIAKLNILNYKVSN